MNKTIDFSNELKEINALIMQVRNDNFKKQSRTNQAAAYALEAGGKRMRPMLFALLLEAYNLDYTKYAEVFSAIEMVHTYSLVHDDLPAMDDDDLRRGKPSTHKQFDEASAILAGDGLLTDAFFLLSKSNLSTEKIVTIIRILSYAAGSNGMIYGQDLDLANEKEKRISLQHLENTYYYKTCLMIEASLAMAATIVGLDVEPFIRLGTLLGQAFQIQDDILEHTSTSEKIGKSVDSDAKNNKQTITNMIGLDNSISLVESYFESIQQIIEQLDLYGSKFHFYIISLANRDK